MDYGRTDTSQRKTTDDDLFASGINEGSGTNDTNANTFEAENNLDTSNMSADWDTNPAESQGNTAPLMSSEAIRGLQQNIGGGAMNALATENTPIPGVQTPGFVPEMTSIPDVQAPEQIPRPVEPSLEQAPNPVIPSLEQAPAPATASLEQAPAPATASPEQLPDPNTPSLGQVTDLAMPPGMNLDAPESSDESHENTPKHGKIKTTEHLNEAGIKAIEQTIEQFEKDGSADAFINAVRDLTDENISSFQGGGAN